MTHPILWSVWGVLLLWALWVVYLAVMNLKRAKDAGTLTFWCKFFGYPVLIVGLLLDLVCNVLVLTALLGELPRELTVTSRLKRHNRTSTGWRKAVAVWAEQLLDQFDPSGDHI
ncbi:MAG: hypothetical protein KKB08_06750 [Gammaproteobacteria bacterium]|nr:hypothetical protein [Gammaproteobacteria bacterium]MBU1816440.1 hypothetical protein [Gammaproteobacteria bacterium]